MHYDVIIVGTSPIVLTKAFFELKLGKTVLIIEKNKNYGGSWQTLDVQDIGIVESGCHIMYRNLKMNKFFVDEIGIDFIDLSPQPKIVKNKKVLNYRFTNFINHTELPLIKFLKGFPRYSFDILNPSKFKYPNGGSFEMVDKLISKLKENNVAFFQRRINSLRILNNKVLINESNISSDKIILTPNTNIKNILYNEGNYKLPKIEKRQVQNLYIRFNYFEKIISYVGIKNSFIYRISDMTYNYNDDYRLYCIQINQIFIDENNNKQILDKVLVYLKSMKFIPQSFDVVEYKFIPFIYEHRKFDEIKYVAQKFNKNIEILYTHNFTHGIAEILD